MIYFMQPTDGGPIKIGFTEDLPSRHKALESYYGRPLALLATMEGGRREESAIHSRFAGSRFGKTEQFRPSADLMEFIGCTLLVGANPEAVEALSPPAKNIFVLRGTEEWKAWLDEVALANGAPLTVTIEQAVRDLAVKLKCRKPPRRTP